MFPPIAAWIHDGHGYIRWVEWRLHIELQNRPDNSLEGSMSVQAKFCGSGRRWYMYIHMRSSSGLFHVHINAKSVNQFPAGKRKFTPPSFGKECIRCCCKIIAPLPLVQPNKECITVFFLMYDGGGIKYFDWKMQILLVCQYYFVYSKKKYKKA